jgi:predicted DNA-binding transcriptional regulator AlpA
VEESLIRSSDVEARTGLSRHAIRRLEKSGRFPKRRKFHKQLVAWNEREIDEWTESHGAAKQRSKSMSADRQASEFLSASRPLTEAGLLCVDDDLISRNARVIDPSDPFAAGAIRLIAGILSKAPRGSAYQLVQWPDGVVGVVRSGLSGEKRVKALARAYQVGFDRLLESFGSQIG